MQTKNSNYWRNRFWQLEESQNVSDVAKFNEIEKQFNRAQKAIEAKINAWYGRFATNNGISLEDARKQLLKSELEELKWDVNDYIKYGKENALNEKWIKELENASAKAHISRLEAIKLQIQAEAEKLFGNVNDDIDQHIKDTYTDSYYHTAYEIQKGTGVGSTLAAIDESKLEKIINKPWAVDEKNFATRLGESKVTLINNIHNSLTQMCLNGENPRKTIAQLAKTMNGDKVRASRIIMTESTYFAQTAQKDCFNTLGVDEFEIVATLDSVTDDVCQGKDGEHYPMKLFEAGVTAPPFHPNCRCCTVPWFDDEFTADEKRIARGEDGEQYYVPADTTYKQWYEKYVADLNQEAQEIKMSDSDIVRLAELRKKYKSLENAMLFGSVDEATEFKRLLELEKATTKPSDFDKLFNQQDYSEKQLISWRNEPNSIQRDAISTYTSSQYVEMNGFLRNGGYATSKTKEEIQTLHEYLSEQKTHEVLYLRRGYSTGNPEKRLGEFKNGDIRSIIGNTINDKGFVSTTAFGDGGFGGNVIMHIKAPQGTRGAYISDISRASNEKEFLLDCNQDFIIKDARKIINEYGFEVIEVFCEVIT